MGHLKGSSLCATMLCHHCCVASSALKSQFSAGKNEGKPLRGASLSFGLACDGKWALLTYAIQLESVGCKMVNLISNYSLLTRPLAAGTQ